ncbi:MAG: hypothetical protein F9K29_01995 [Hyphomicrobiaceae bacterium]|nr:MAG: hypothetical protein F9K29_01995 [Hyphomicrobiaceae bacterium]
MNALLGLLAGLGRLLAPMARLLAGLLLLIAVVAAVYDATRTMSANSLVMTSLGEHWSKLAPASLGTAQAAVQRYAHPVVWTSLVHALLLVPAWLFFGGLGILLAVVARQRRRVNVFAN